MWFEMLTDETYTFWLFSWKKYCIGGRGSAFTIVYICIASPTVGTLLSEQKKLNTFWKGIPPDETFMDLKLLALWV